MKFCLFFNLIFMLQLSASVYSQNTIFTLSLKEQTVKEILDNIESQSEFRFFYNDKFVEMDRRTSVVVENRNIDELLNQLFDNTAITYKVLDNNLIVITPREMLQQGIPVTGTVIDETGDAMPGVNVVVKGTLSGVITDINGNFSITVPDKDAVLLLSFVGYTTQEVLIGERTNFKLTMDVDAHEIEEIVVVGYGTQKKANLTGAVTQIDSKVFETRPVTSVATALQGTMPGVNISPSTGNPNQGLEINIRGTTSINGGGPLVLVDGVETNLSLVNPNDIENISVLKDAAAASIYGVRAAFGVVLVTTKKGKTGGKLNVNYSGNFGWSRPTYMPDFVDNSYDHVTFVNQSLLNNNAAVMYKDKQVEAVKAYAENPNGPEYYIEDGQYVPIGYRNWKDILIRNNAPKQNHSFSVSGGNDKTSFYASAAYLKQEGMTKINPDIYERVNTRLNVENQTYNWMKLGLRMLYNTSKMDEPHKYKEDVWHGLLFTSPLRGGQWLGDPAYPQYDHLIGYYLEDQNTEVLLKYGGRNIKQQHEIMISPGVDITPLKNWNIHVDFSYSKTFGDDTKDKKKLNNLINYRMLNVDGATSDNYYEVFNSQKNYYSFNLYTDYELRIAAKNHIKVMVGYNQELTRYKASTATRKDLLNPELPSLSLGVGEQTVKEDGYEWALRGGFARINYNYDNRYLLELNGRYDGTSRFPKDNRFVFLPSFSVGWRLSEEHFMDFIKPTVNNIKFRASYGKLGNQLLTDKSWTGNTKYYPYISFLRSELSDYYLFGQAKDIIINPSALTPNALTWEKVSTINGGVEVTLFKSRLDMSFDIYQRTTSDMLIKQDYPEILGTTAPVVNKGELKTKGWELTASWRDNINKDLSYNIGVSVHDAHAEISKYDGIKGNVTDFYVGKKDGEIWGYETEGFFQSPEDIQNHVSQTAISNNWKVGDIKYRNLNGDDRINTGSNTIEDPGDRRVIGNTTSRYNYSITGGVNYKGIFLNFFLQGVGKRDYFPSTEDFWPVATQYYNTQKRFLSDCWSPENTDAYYALPRARSTQNRQNQTKYLQDASYLRLKNLTIGYNLPTSLIQKIHLSRAQIYFSGENLWEHSNLVGPYDPESAGEKGTYNYPFQRVFSIGVDLTF